MFRNFKLLASEKLEVQNYKIRAAFDLIHLMLMQI